MTIKNNARVLKKGYSISPIIKGGWQLAGGHGVIDKESAIADMFRFVQCGITTFDCADIYTGVEEMIGEFLRQYRKRYGRTKASAIHIHTKCVPDLDKLSTISKEYIESIIDRSRERLGLQQLDVVQFHWWDFDIPGHMQVMEYLAELQKAGKIRHLAVTNFDMLHLQDVKERGISIVSNQVQYSLLDHRPEHGMVEFCRKNAISLLCYGTLAGGFLSEKYLGIPEPVEPLENRSLTKYKLIINEFGGRRRFQILLKTLSRVAQKHHVTISHVAMKYIIEKPIVAAIIVGARNSAHLRGLEQVFSFDLDEEDKEKIRHVVGSAEGPAGDIYSVERIKNGPHATIMKYNLSKV